MEFLTLSGEATYLWRDPITGDVKSVIVQPGTLLLSRSGESEFGPQIEHAVGPPRQPGTVEAPIPSTRVALLMSMS